MSEPEEPLPDTRLRGERYTFPSHCQDCGAPLKGGDTIHAADCWCFELISRNFPGYVRV